MNDPKLTKERIKQIIANIDSDEARGATQSVMSYNTLRELCELALQGMGGTVGANGWSQQIQTGYIHQGCGACWKIVYNDTGLYVKCSKCGEGRLIDSTFPLRTTTLGDKK